MVLNQITDGPHVSTFILDSLCIAEYLLTYAWISFKVCMGFIFKSLAGYICIMFIDSENIYYNHARKKIYLYYLWKGSGRNKSMSSSGRIQIWMTAGIYFFTN